MRAFKGYLKALLLSTEEFRSLLLDERQISNNYSLGNLGRKAFRLSQFNEKKKLEVK